MTAALVLEPRERSETRRLSAVRPEPDLIKRARCGDEAALSALFDSIVADVYGQAFASTHSVRKAERVTDRTVGRLPKALRSRRWESVEALRGHMLALARSELTIDTRRQAAAQSRRDFRALTRHLMLATTASVAAVYAVVQAL
jgi:hypothetical protein